MYIYIGWTDQFEQIWSKAQASDGCGECFSDITCTLMYIQLKRKSVIASNVHTQGGPQGPRGAHKGQAHKGPGGPTRAQGGPQGPGPGPLKGPGPGP